MCISTMLDLIRQSQAFNFVLTINSILSPDLAPSDFFLFGYLKEKIEYIPSNYFASIQQKSSN